MGRRELLVMGLGLFTSAIALVGCEHGGGKKELMIVPENAVYYVEVVSNDVAGTRALYEKAYGWRFEPMGPEMGNSFVAPLPNGARFGIRAPLRADEAPIVRTYLRVKDIERAAKAAQELGAKVALEPTELPGQGRIAIYLLGGIEQGLWQLP